eukprot:g678.t1
MSTVCCCSGEPKKWETRDENGVRTSEEFYEEKGVGMFKICGRIVAVCVFIVAIIAATRVERANKWINSMEFERISSLDRENVSSVNDYAAEMLRHPFFLVQNINNAENAGPLQILKLRDVFLSALARDTGVPCEDATIALKIRAAFKIVLEENIFPKRRNAWVRKLLRWVESYNFDVSQSHMRVRRVEMFLSESRDRDSVCLAVFTDATVTRVEARLAAIAIDLALSSPVARSL